MVPVDDVLMKGFEFTLITKNTQGVSDCLCVLGVRFEKLKAVVHCQKW